MTDRHARFVERHTRLMTDAHGAINRVFRDSSIGKDQLLDSLKELRDLCADLCDIIREQLTEQYWDEQEQRRFDKLIESGYARKMAADFIAANTGDLDGRDIREII